MLTVAEESRRKDLVVELARGAEKSFKNAVLLFEEASLLTTNGFSSRALFLHQISMEECAKVEMLGAAASGILMGIDFDEVKLKKDLASHKAKNHANAYMLPLTDAERVARDSGDWKDSIKAFEKQKAEFHTTSNAAKNTALYVDFVDGHFVSPGDRITPEATREIQAYNAKYLSLMAPMQRMLLNWAEEPGHVGNILLRQKTIIEKLKAEMPDDPTIVMVEVVNEMIEDYKKRKRGGFRLGVWRRLLS